MNNTINLFDVAQKIPHFLWQGFQCSVEEDRIHVSPLFSLDPRLLVTAADALRERLHMGGYTRFAVCFSSTGLLLIDGRTFELQLAQWVDQEGGEAIEAARRIRCAFYSGSSSLSLDELGLKTLPPVFDRMKNLKSLDLSINQLTDAPISSLVNLRELDLEGNQLTCLSGLDALVNLEYLDLSRNNFAEFLIPDTLVNLQLLNLFDNLLTSLSVPPTLTQLQTLDLSDNLLTALLGLDALSNLQELFLCSNQFSTFSLPNTLINLQKLDLSGNKLTALLGLDALIHLRQLLLFSNQFPILSIPNTLINLQELNLSNNKLSLLSVPDTLVNLQELHLDCNALTALLVPDTLVNLQQLGLCDNGLTDFSIQGILFNLNALDLSYNSDLQTLPLVLSQCTNLIDLFIEGTSIPPELCESILNICEDQRAADALHALPMRLNNWISASKEPLNLAFINQLSEKEKLTINEWLARLERTNDFTTKHQQALTHIVCKMLLSLETNSAFKEVFFTQVSVNQTACGDRAAMALNELYLSWTLTALPENSTQEKKLLLMESAAKTVALRNALAHLLSNKEERESVEIYLYYEVTLQKRLNLLTAFQSMTFTDIGKRVWIDQEALVQTVNNTYLDQLCTLPQLQELASKDPLFVTESRAISQKSSNELETISDQLTDVEIAKKADRILGSKRKAEEELLQEWVQKKRKTP
ncbi:MAG: leucine-rich repeat domain-containing protein [Verrucomicrobiota bacterium]|nr:leucine-rich repeat domain-containing protein [Verrucomicrobiota bacterium]